MSVLVFESQQADSTYIISLFYMSSEGLSPLQLITTKVMKPTHVYFYHIFHYWKKKKKAHSYGRQSVWFAIIFFSSGWQPLHLKSEDQINKYLVIFINSVGLESPGNIPNQALSRYWVDNGTNILFPQRSGVRTQMPPGPDSFFWSLDRVPSRGSSSDTSSGLEAFLFLIHSWTAVLCINPEAT